MKLTRCKLLRKQQLKLLEYSVLEVTARSAADILGIQPNTAMLFYRKLRQIISHHVELQAAEIFDGAVELALQVWADFKSGCTHGDTP